MSCRNGHVDMQLVRKDSDVVARAVDCLHAARSVGKFAGSSAKADQTMQRARHALYQVHPDMMSV